jgi:hypothetical protein
LSNTKPFDQSELIRLALAGLDAQIAELQEKRAQLAVLTDPQPAAATVKAVATPTAKGGKMSDEARAKISAAATARWARVKKAQAEAAKSVPAAKKAPAKKKSVKGKKAPAKKGNSKTPAAAETEATKAE